MSLTPERSLTVPVGEAGLFADVAVPEGSVGTVVFAHGSGSSRASPRNRQVAATLQEVGLATVLVDLLTEEEDQVDARTRQLRFDIDLLASRVLSVTEWLRAQSDPITSVGLFGASTGAGAALKAAGERPDAIGAVVSRGGRPDLAGPHLASVRAPTLLIVGSRDTQVIELNQVALQGLECEKKLDVVDGASHLFEERGAMEEVARLAGDWFLRHLAGALSRTGDG